MSAKDLIAKELKKRLEELEDGICCVCGHPLNCHIDEGDYWRCHYMGYDFYQCECVLRKDRARGDINYYDLKRRLKERLKELEEKEI